MTKFTCQIAVAAFAATLVVAGVLISSPAIAAAEPFTFSETTETQIRRADEKADLPTLYRLLFAEIAKEPELAPQIVERLVVLAPQRRDDVVRTASAAFPQYASDFEAVKAHPAQKPAEVTKPVFSGEIDISAGTQTGNDPTDSVDAAVKISYVPEPWEHTAAVKFDLAQDSERVTTDRLVVDYTPRYNITDRFFIGGYNEFVRDHDDGFKWTSVEAVGPGYRIFNNDTVKLTVSAGPGLRQRQEKDRDGGRLQNDPIGIGRVQFSWQITDRAQMSNNAVVFGDEESVVTRNTTAFTLKFLDNVAGRLSYEVRNNSNPPEDTKSLDTEAKASIVYGF